MRVRYRRSRTGGIVLAAMVLGWAHGAGAEPSWVSGEVKLNLRRGASTEYKIIGSVSSNEPVTVLDTENGWTHVRLQDGQEGWIPGGYLSTNPPPQIRLSQLETEASSLRERLRAAEGAAERLTTENRSLTEADAGQRERLARLSAENRELRALVRWREWITGASILVFGMIVGAILSRSSSRRRSTRLRV